MKNTDTLCANLLLTEGGLVINKMVFLTTTAVVASHLIKKGANLNGINDIRVNSSAIRL